MTSDWRAEQLAHLNKKEFNKCIFKEIPTNIGRIVYCDTSTGIKSMTKGDIIMQRVISLVIFSIVVTLVWTLIGSTSWCVAITIISSLMLIGALNASFEGEDYFVGTTGFARIKFEKDRRNITRYQVVHYNQISAFCTQEKIVRKRTRHQYGMYDYTACHYTAYKKKENEAQPSIIYESYGKYEAPNGSDSLDPPCADCECRFMRVVEDMWTNIFIANHRGEHEIDFPTLDFNGIFRHHRLTLYPWGVQAYDTTFKTEELKGFYLKDGKIVLEHSNHSAKLFGLKQEGEKEKISYHKISNAKAFVTLLSEMIARRDKQMQ